MKEYIFEAEKVDWLGAYHVNEVKGELIRCKDCKWWNGYYSCIRTASDDFDEDDYCSLAEMEEE